MRHRIARAILILGVGGLLTLYALSGAAADGHAAHLLVLDDAIEPVSANLIGRAIDDAEAAGAHLLVLDDAIEPVSANLIGRAIDDAEAAGAHLFIVQLNTPGGLYASTRDIVEDIFAAELPVAVYVAPSGAGATSAGTFVAAAAHIAAMAPATTIGAASPVGAGGEDLPDTIRSKATEDAAAYLRSIAVERGRNADALQETVLEATSYSADEAVEKGVVDFTAKDIPDLLARMDGLSVEVNGERRELATGGIGITQIQPTLVERFMDVIANPNIAFLLLTIGGICVLVEALSPGLLGPGAVGAIALALAFLAFGNLPVNWVGVGLIILAMGLFFAEAQAPGVSVFGVSGAIGFLLGAFLLFGNFSFAPTPPALPDAPSFRINILVIGAVSLLMFGSLLVTLKAVRDAKKVRAYTGASANASVMGQVGKTTSELDPMGSVQIGGERWTAESETGERIPVDEDVIVLDIRGLRLIVSRLDGTTDPEEWQC